MADTLRFKTLVLKEFSLLLPQKGPLFPSFREIRLQLKVLIQKGAKCQMPNCSRDAAYEIIKTPLALRDTKGDETDIAEIQSQEMQTAIEGFRSRISKCGLCAFPGL